MYFSLHSSISHFNAENFLIKKRERPKAKQRMDMNNVRVQHHIDNSSGNFFTHAGKQNKLTFFNYLCKSAEALTIGVRSLQAYTERE